MIFGNSKNQGIFNFLIHNTGKNNDIEISQSEIPYQSNQKNTIDDEKIYNKKTNDTEKIFEFNIKDRAVEPEHHEAMIRFKSGFVQPIDSKKYTITHAKSYFCIDLIKEIIEVKNNDNEIVNLFNENTKMKSAFSFQQGDYSFMDVLLENDYQPISLNENFHATIVNEANRDVCGLNFDGTFGNNQLYLIDTNSANRNEIQIDVLGFMTNLTIDIF